jgi:hypothetical protein
VQSIALSRLFRLGLNLLHVLGLGHIDLVGLLDIRPEPRPCRPKYADAD